MARVTRSSAKLPASPSPASGTGTSSASPIFSAQASVVASETPATSDNEATEKTQRASSTRGRGKKRAASSEIDDSEPETASVKRPAAKRRAVYVEVPSFSSVAKVKGKAKATSSVPQRKGKGKAPVVPTPCISDDDEEMVSEPGLEYDEDQMLDESEDSGSEFEVSEEDEDAFAASDSEEEAFMLSAAAEMSLQTSRPNGAIAGSSSSSQRGARNSAAALRAAAAERRLTRRNKDIDVDDYVAGASDDELAESSGSESDVPLSRKGKGVAKKSKTAAPAPKPMARKKHMTLAELRKEKREQRRQGNAWKKENKAEEQRLVRELGRRLTYAEKSSIALHRHHPELKDVWGDLEESIPIVTPEKAEQPARLKLTLLPFQQESLFWMRKQEQGIWHGGMLADEMGMGKTIQIIALLVSDSVKPNLVVAPTVAVMQWKNEIDAHAEGLKALVWHGSSRESDVKELKKYDVVLTTYAVMESCFRKQQSGFKRKGMIVKEKSPIHEIHWNRIVLDEAHNIKERSTNTAKAAFELKGNYRWCLSGTPLQNRVGELYSLVRFLGGDPFSYYFCKACDCKSLHWTFSDKRTCDDCGHTPMQHTCFWNNEILTPIQKHGMVGPGKPAFKKLRILLDRMMLRRTKLQKADDLGLPPRTVIVRRDYFSPEEKDLYLSLYSNAKRQFSTYVDQGTVLNNFSNIFTLLTRLRQMACHPDLVLRSKTNAQSFTMDDLEEATVCRICNDIAEDAIQAKCRHIFDRECIKQYLETSEEDIPKCPTCHLPLTIDLEAPALELEETVAKARQGILGRLNLEKWRSSSKIEALVEELSNLRMQDATTKSIVFSQFVNFLDLIAFRLQKAGFNLCRLEGTMSPQARDATIKHFTNNVDVTVFLVSLKAGGVALNLTEASRVYLMDSWWNPAVEFQAMDRIHRLGQHRPVQAIKLVVEDSIESQIVQLQEKKSAMVNATLSADDQAMGRLTPEDLSFLFRL
ncbi:putative SNF2 family N-terminal domain containing protein [Lyophyllum shimeji]|uniref:SNF2 family N-terminal domain containing protein n=1 Tax=Lyophyllum shimeji TaxID=47721 RepID=A0A9P3PCD5_LYOSH|nr:putative SNF2 family N-terminal domain containing protein [Lyophyllum shimeji]